MDNITKDPAYNAVDPNDFPAMLDTKRYGERSTAFDKIISATHDHFWDPLDKKYIDFSEPFDIENEYLVKPESSPDLKTAIGDRLDEKGKIAIDSKETIEAMKYAVELQQTMIPGTLSWNDAGNNKAYAAGEISLTFNGVPITTPVTYTGTAADATATTTTATAGLDHFRARADASLLTILLLSCATWDQAECTYGMCAISALASRARSRARRAVA